MLIVSKFGGSSLADAARFLRVREIVRSDPGRRVVVVSAPGKRHAADHKITDLLYLCRAHLRCGVSCWDLFRRVKERYVAIRDGCALSCPIERELDALYSALGPDFSEEELVSRGEYWSARLMAELLDFEFLDAADWLVFDAAGQVDKKESYGRLEALAAGRRIVTPGFYGAMPDGSVHTLPRGGSDVTGSLAAAALGADLCENWTDVPGVLRADPRAAEHPPAIPLLCWPELQLRAGVGLPVLHEDAAAPLRERGIPLRILSTFEPEEPGTLVTAELPNGAPAGPVGFACRKNLTLLALAPQKRAGDAQRVRALLARTGSRVFLSSEGPDGAAFLLDGPAPAGLAGLVPAERLCVAGQVGVIAGVFRGAERAPEVLAAVAAAAPVLFSQLSGSCLMAAVPERSCGAALRAAAGAV